MDFYKCIQFQNLSVYQQNIKPTFKNEEIRFDENNSHIIETDNQKQLIKELNKKNIYLFIGKPQITLYEKIFQFLKREIPLKEQLLLIKTRSQGVSSLSTKLKRWSSIILYTQDEEGYFKGQKNRVLLGEGTGIRRYSTKILLRPYYTFDTEDDEDFDEDFDVAETICFDNLTPQARQFHSDNLYYPKNNQGGFKSICPVFLDFKTAEDFLNSAINTDLDLLADITSEGKYYEPHIILNNKWKASLILDPLLNSNIIKIGLGDFIRYYSQFDVKNTHLSLELIENNPLNKIEFLFIPNPKQLIKFERKKTWAQVFQKILFFLPKHFTKIQKPLSFNDYINLYYSLK